MYDDVNLIYSFIICLIPAPGFLTFYIKMNYSNCTMKLHQLQTAVLKFFPVAITHLCHCGCLFDRGVSITVDPFWDISLDLGPSGGQVTPTATHTPAPGSTPSAQPDFNDSNSSGKKYR